MFYLKSILIILLLFVSNMTLAIDNTKIKIIGNENIDDEVIFSIIDSELTDLSDENVNQIIKSLYLTGNFKDIEVQYTDNDILLKITENPTIQKISFIGNKRFKNNEIFEIFNKDEFFLVLNDSKIENFISNLSDLYLSFGYNLIDIKHETKINLSNENFVDLEFIIDEGNISKINKITFVGNNEYSKNKLRSIIKSKQKNFLRYFSNSNYKEFEIRKDYERLINFYKSNGFRNIDIDLQTEFISSKNRFNIYFYINEGDKFIFRNIDLNFNSLVVDDSYKENLHNINKIFFDKKILKDLTYDNEKITELKDDLTDYLYNLGTYFFEVNVLEKIENANIDIILEIKNINPKYVNQINIMGNTRTKEKVIRREIPFAEGDSINNDLVRKTNRNISKLGFFKSVNIKEVKNEDFVDLDIEVEESSTGQFNFGVSFDSYNGASLISGLQEKNIFGDGRNLDLTLNTSDNKNKYRFGIVEPYIFNKKIDLIYDLGFQENDYAKSSSYKLETFSSSIGLRYLLTDQINHTISFEYALKDYTITDASTVSSNINKQAGKNSEISLNNSLVYNDLDSFVRPTEGDFIRYDNVLSPVTNDDNGYIKNILTHKKYYKLKSNVFSIQNRIGNIFSLQNDEIPVSDKFSLGGRWLRGFDSFGAGPRDSRTSYIGGNNLVVTKLDYQRPVFNDLDNPIDLNLFLDAGTVFDNKVKPTHSDNTIRSSFGYAFKFYSPIGPVGFSWAYPISDESYDIKKMFNFSIGNLN